MSHYGVTQRTCEDTFEFVLLSPTLVWSTPLSLPGQCGGCMHQRSTSGIRKKNKKNKQVTLNMLTHGAMRGCGLTSLMVCTNDNFRDIRERNVTIKSEIWTRNIDSLEFWDIKKWVTLWRLISHNLGCVCLQTETIAVKAPVILILHILRWHVDWDELKNKQHCNSCRWDLVVVFPMRWHLYGVFFLYMILMSIVKGFQLTTLHDMRSTFWKQMWTL